MLGTEDHEEEDTNSNVSGGYTLKQNEPPDNNYSAEENEVSEQEEEEDIVDTKAILERYRYVIKKEEIGTRKKICGKTFSGTKSVKKHMNGT